MSCNLFGLGEVSRPAEMHQLVHGRSCDDSCFERLWRDGVVVNSHRFGSVVLGQLGSFSTSVCCLHVSVFSA